MTTTQLANLIARHSELYYFGTPEITDAEFDGLLATLREMDPNHPILSTVGGSLINSPLSKVQHSRFAGSLGKATVNSEFQQWWDKQPIGVKVISLKMDGGSVSLTYKNGKLVQSVTRGDGHKGEDITKNSRMWSGVPAFIDDTREVLVKGEVVLKVSKWHLVDPDKKTNPRNVACGCMRRLDGVGNQHLSFVAFDTDAQIQNTIKLDTLRDWGFEVPEHSLVSSVAECLDFFNAIASKRSSLDAWIDGTVCTSDRYDGSVDSSGNYNGGIAWKFPSEAVTTKLVGITTQVGLSGAIVPRGVLQPVDLMGTTVSACALNNFDYIEALDLAIGDTVEIIKGGDIIPKLVKVVERPSDRIAINPPKVVDGCEVVRAKNSDGSDGAAWVINHPFHPAVFKGRLKKWTQDLQILGFGDVLIDKVVDEKLVQSIADIYDINWVTVIGEALGTKLNAQIKAKSTLNIVQILGNLGVPGLGVRKVEDMLAKCPELEDLSLWFGEGAITARADKLGMPNSASVLQAKLDDLFPEVMALLMSNVVKIVPIAKSQTAEGAKSFCLTGKMNRSRNDWESEIKRKGHIVFDGVKKGLDYLVIADPSSTSSKAVDARRLGIKLISEDELSKILNA